jgi:predicted RND superfamily exporter protein
MKPNSDGEASLLPSVGTGKPASPADKGFSLAFGLERLALIPMRAPALSIVIAIVLAIAAAFGIQRIRIDDSLGQLFRSDTAEFRTFEQVSREFPSSEYDVLVVIDGKSLLERDSLEKLRSLVVDLQLVEGARGVISLFSAREPPAAVGGLPLPLFPDELPEGAEYQSLIQRATHNDIVRGKLLSEDGTLALVVLALDPSVVESGKLGAVVADLRRTAEEDMAGAGLAVELSGVPVMQIEIRNALERDRIVYNAIGFIAGCGIAILFFRRFSFMVVAAGPPLLAIAFALGALGWMGFQLNLFLNVMTPLIMVISFSDSMQLTFAARDRMIAGENARAAFRGAIEVVGPACVLTHATAGLSFLGLLYSDSQTIRAFGEAGFISVAVALVSVLSLVPVFGVVLLRNPGSFAATVSGRDSGVDALRRFCDWVALHMVRRPGLNTGIGLVVVALLGIACLGLNPGWRLADEVPDKEQAVQASGRLDAKLTGANPVDVLIRFPEGVGLYDPQTLETIAEVTRALEGQAGLGNVWSLETLRRWLAQNLGKNDVATLKQYVDELPSSLVRRFVNEKQDAVIVSGRIPDKDVAGLAPILAQLNQTLDGVRAKHPGYLISPTGLSVIATHSSASMINKLTRGLTIEFVFIAAFIGLAFRSLPVMLASLLPGIFPIVAAGALLRLMNAGLQFSSVIALTVSFGLGLSATIHFLNRMWREDDPNSDPAIAVERATVLVGPALILTSVVLACGLAALVFSNLPALRLFGWVSAFAMVAALAADLLILRPAITFLVRLQRRFKPSLRIPDGGRTP